MHGEIYNGFWRWIRCSPNFSVWEEQDATCVISYTQQDSFMYLSVVHMWDREYKYPFVKKKAPMPHQAMIDDGHVYDVINSNDDGDDGEKISRQLSFTPANNKSSALFLGTSKKQRAYLSALSKLDQGCEEAKKNANKITC